MGWTYSDPDLFGKREYTGYGNDEVRVGVLDKSTADAIMRRGHYSGSVAWSSNQHFGIYVGREIVGACQFGPAMNPASGANIVAGTEPDQWTELNRLWIAGGQPANTTSRAVSYAIRLLKKRRPRIAWVQSFADERCGSGGIYRACSFLYLGSHEQTFYLLDGEWYHKSMLGRAEYDRRGWWCGPKIAHFNAHAHRAERHTFRQFRYLRPIDGWVRKKLLIEPQPYPVQKSDEVAA